MPDATWLLFNVRVQCSHSLACLSRLPERTDMVLYLLKFNLTSSWQTGGPWATCSEW
jgi:hypothetical protein